MERKRNATGKSHAQQQCSYVFGFYRMAFQYQELKMFQRRGQRYRREILAKKKKKYRCYMLYAYVLTHKIWGSEGKPKIATRTHSATLV